MITFFKVMAPYGYLTDIEEVTHNTNNNTLVGHYYFDNRKVSVALSGCQYVLIKGQEKKFFENEKELIDYLKHLEIKIDDFIFSFLRLSIKPYGNKIKWSDCGLFAVYNNFLVIVTER